jgi:hypothetical protein
MKLTAESHLYSTGRVLNIVGKKYTMWVGHAPSEYYPVKDEDGKELFFRIEYETDCDGNYWVSRFLDNMDGFYEEASIDYVSTFNDREFNELQQLIDIHINEPAKDWEQYVQSTTPQERERARRTRLTDLDDKLRGY